MVKIAMSPLAAFEISIYFVYFYGTPTFAQLPFNLGYKLAYAASHAASNTPN